MTTAFTSTKTAFGTGVSKKDNSFEAGQEAARKALDKITNSKPQFGLVFASSKYDYKEVLRGMASLAGDAQIIGCSSAGEFTEEGSQAESVVCAFIASNNHKFFTSVGKGIKEDPVKAVAQAASALPKEVPGFPALSAMILMDGLCGVGEEVCAAALSSLGPTVRFSGGAAGDDLKLQSTSVFHNSQALSNAAAICLMASKSPVSIGVKHGHCALSQPLTITKTSGSRVLEIEGKPAFEVWKEHTRAKAKEKGIDVDKLKTASEIGNFLLQYEAGLLTGMEYKLRAPLSVNPDQSINFVCTMMEGSVIRIMETPNRYYQIASAKTAAEIAKANTKDAKIAGAIVFDCVCRRAILDKDYGKAVEEIQSVVGKQVPVIGFATYGEIAMEIGQLSGFHNTTTVVLLIPE